MTLVWHRGPGMVEHAHHTQEELDACEIQHRHTLQNLEITMSQSTVRTLAEIAADIRAAWPKMTEPLSEETFFGMPIGEHPARPYVDAMALMSSMNDHYGYESAREIVLRFLDAASTWRGPKAREIKAELRGML